MEARLPSQRREALKRFATEQLTSEERLLIELFYYEKMTPEEIALTLDLAPVGVIARFACVMNRARESISAP